jgi:hypothetical protein
VLSLPELGTDDQLGPATLDIKTFPNPDGSTGQEGTIKLNVFRDIFAGDLSKKLARNMALSQRPASLVALGEPSGVPRKTITVKGASHVVMVSRPKATADLILAAAKAQK